MQFHLYAENAVLKCSSLVCLVINDDIVLLVKHAFCMCMIR